MKGIPPWLRNLVFYAAKLLPVSHHPFKVGQHHAVLLFPLFFFSLCPQDNIFVSDFRAAAIPVGPTTDFSYYTNVQFAISDMVIVVWRYFNFCVVLPKADIPHICLEHDPLLSPDVESESQQDRKSCVYTAIFLQFNIT